MGKHNRRSIILLMIAILMGNILPACADSSTQEAVVITRQQAEHELVTFMLDLILNQEIPKYLPYIPPGERSIRAPAAVASLIIQAPPIDAPQPGENPLDLTQPLRVWLYKDNQLFEAIDKTETIQQYRQDHMNYQLSQDWGFYNFGIVSISDDGQQAKVYWEVSCGFDCGHGYLNLMQRNAQGKWQITGAEWGWIA